jgi:hypothetical protein
VTGTPRTVTVHRDVLVGAARELAKTLKAEMDHLDRDARALEERGNRLFAAEVRSLRTRLAKVLAAAVAVVVSATGRAV